MNLIKSAVKAKYVLSFYGRLRVRLYGKIAASLVRRAPRNDIL